MLPMNCEQKKTLHFSIKVVETSEKDALGDTQAFEEFQIFNITRIQYSQNRNHECSPKFYADSKNAT